MLSEFGCFLMYMSLMLVRVIGWLFLVGFGGNCGGVVLIMMLIYVCELILGCCGICVIMCFECSWYLFSVFRSLVIGFW